jgi:hypothetical protein
MHKCPKCGMPCGCGYKYGRKVYLDDEETCVHFETEECAKRRQEENWAEDGGQNVGRGHGPDSDESNPKV